MTLALMALDYRNSAAMIRLRIIALEDARKTAAGRERSQLDSRIYQLSAMYRETMSMARVLEHYYDKEDEHEATDFTAPILSGQ